MTDMNETAEHKRPLWRRMVDFPLVAMLIAVLLFVLGITAAGFIAKFATPNVPGLAFELKVDLIAIPILVIVYKLLIARLGEHPRDDFRDPKAVPHLLAGIVGGTIIFSIAVAVAAAMGIYRIVGVGNLNGLLPALIASAIFPAVSEEMLFRGILFRWLEEFGGSWLAIFLTSALFGAAHLLNPHASVIAAVGIAFEAGVMLGAAYMLTRSLWLPMGLHAAWNFTQGEIYDIPVSGTNVDGMLEGTLSGPPLLTGNGFGLEASPIAMVVATMFGLWLLNRAARGGLIVQPMWVRRRLAEPVAA